MLTEKSIEERVWETLRLKKSLFAGVFDSPTGEVSFEKLGKKTILQTVKEIFAKQPDRPKPIIDHAPAGAIALASAQSEVQAQQPGSAGAVAESAGAPPATGDRPDGIALAAASFIEAGLKLIESFAGNATNGKAGASPNHLDQALSALFTQDARTRRPSLRIPLPESVTQERLAGAVSALLTAFGQKGTAAGRESER